MGCNCKKGNMDELIKNNGSSNSISTKTIIKYVLKTFGFILFLVLLPFINVYIIYMVFDMFILNNHTDFKPMILALGKKFSIKEESDEEFLDEDEYNELTEDDVVLMDSEEINTDENFS